MMRLCRPELPFRSFPNREELERSRCSVPRWLPCLLLCVVCGMGASRHCFAEETNDAEAKEAADEEADQHKKEIELDRPIFSFSVGLLLMKDKEHRGDNNGVVATLLTDDKKEYQLKLSSPDLIDGLEKLNGKRVKLRGNPRNKGKYFVVQTAALAAPTDK